jgi:hypothetical protein
VKGAQFSQEIEWRPNLLANLWHNLREVGRVRFENIPIATRLGGTSIEVGLRVTW